MFSKFTCGKTTKTYFQTKQITCFVFRKTEAPSNLTTLLCSGLKKPKPH